MFWWPYAYLWFVNVVNLLSDHRTPTPVLEPLSCALLFERGAIGNSGLVFIAPGSPVQPFNWGCGCVGWERAPLWESVWDPAGR